MILLFRIFLLLVSPIIFCQAVIIPVIYGNYLFDFCTFGDDFTTVMANRWIISRDLTGQAKVSSCNTDRIFGGYGILRGGDTISRTYDYLPSHGMVTFSIFITIIETWQTADTMSLWVDSNPAFNFSPQELLTKTGATSNDCSGIRFVTFAFLVGRIQHSSSTLTFKLSSTTNTQGYYGIKDVLALFTPYSSSSPTGIYLITKNENSGIKGALYCSEWKYKDSNNVCQSCHLNCHQCFGPGENECYGCRLDSTYDVTLGKCVPCTTGCMQCSGIQSNQCLVCKHQDGYVLDYDGTCKTSCTSPYVEDSVTNSEGRFCRHACPNPSDFRLIDDTCVSSCPTPLVQRISGDGKGKFCDSPCGQSSINYYYWNTSCKSTCPFLSRTQNGYNFCDACNNGQFMYANGSCQATCSSLFNVNTVEGYKFCDFPCGRFSTDYYYWNTSCEGTCAFYSRINDGFHFCDACSPGHFMHPNISCETSCNYPYKNRTQGGSMFCDYPCQTNEYFYWNHTCKSNCNSSNVKQTMYFDYCKTPCQQSNEYMFKNNSCSATCTAPLVAITEVDAKFCDFPCGRFSNDYYYWNTSCKSTCPFYSQNTDGYNFCDVCLGGKFMHSNRSCETGCASPFNTLVVEGYKFCDFPCGRFSTDYYYWNTSCEGTCAFYSRINGGFRFCDACPLGSGLFMHPNTSCLVNCTFPYKSRTQGGSLLCDYPCQTGEYYDWNYICKPSCSSPLVKRTLFFDYCETPCQKSDNYMLWDDSCSNSCLEPLVIRTENKARFCDSPCGRTSNDFLYWNGSCIAICPYYKRNANGYIFCDACQLGYFMYPNTTCLSQCSFPYTLKKQGGSQFCLYPCEKMDQFYYPVQKQCLSLCKYPYQIQDEIFCVLIIQKEEATQLQTVASATSGSNTITSSISNSVGLVNFQNPAIIFSQLFSGMLDYIKFTSIKFPPKLQYVYDADPDPLFRIIPLLPEVIKEKFPVKSLPDNFKKYNLHSSFFVNFWDSFFTLVCILISIVLVVIMGLLTNNCSSVQSLCNYIKNLLKWNFFLVMFTSYFGDIMLFSSLEFRTIDFDYVFPILSLVLCLLTNILIFLLFIKMIMVIIARRALKKQMNSNSRVQRAKKKSLLKHLAGFEVMFEGSRDSTVMQQAFMFLFIGRYFLFAGVIAYLYQYPLVQISIICFMSGSMFIYLIIVRPMKTIVDFLQYFLEELTMLVCKICLLILSVYDELQYEENGTREILGEVILIAMLVLNGLSALYMVFQLLGTVRGVYQTIVIWHTKSKDIESAKNEASDVERQTITKNLPIKPKNIRSEWRAKEKSLQFLDVKQEEEKNENFLRRRGEREESVQASHHLEGKRIRKRAFKKPIAMEFQRVMNNRTLN